SLDVDGASPAAYSSMDSSNGSPGEESAYWVPPDISRYSTLTKTIGSTSSTLSSSSSSSISSSSNAGIPNSEVEPSASGSYSCGSLPAKLMEASMVCAGMTYTWLVSPIASTCASIYLLMPAPIPDVSVSVNAPTTTAVTVRNVRSLVRSVFAKAVLKMSSVFMLYPPCLPGFRRLECEFGDRILLPDLHRV